MVHLSKLRHCLGVGIIYLERLSSLNWQYLIYKVDHCLLARYVIKQGEVLLYVHYIYVEVIFP